MPVWKYKSMKAIKAMLDLRDLLNNEHSIHIIAFKWHKCEKDVVISFYLVGIGIMFQYTFFNPEHPI